ncbi:MAG: family 20 glycosylhydrolase [Bacteroidales bacterium]|nr:beta-N-acetylhexosaminidase [Bacteroidales bacterium]
MSPRLYIFSVFLFFISSFHAENIKKNEKLPSPFCIIPEPKNVILLKGVGLTPNSLEFVKMVGDFEQPVMGNILSRLTKSEKLGKNVLTLLLDSTENTPENQEGYVLLISDDAVAISSKSETGLFYGCQSLEQLLEDSQNNKKSIPACKITDYPVLMYRAVHFDVKHHLDHMNYYYESIDRLARYKINAVVFEFEDKLRYQRQPLIGAPQSISIDEMAALTRYAKKRHIEITPLVQGLGHASYILKHKEYANLREIPWNTWAFCPMDEGTYQVLFDMYRDAFEATPGSKYIHIGGDEIGNIGLCPRCKPLADKEGMISLNFYWLKKVCEFAKENNRIPIFWDDMPLQYAGLYESTYSNKFTKTDAAKIWEKRVPKLDSILIDFPKNCVYMRWNYTMARQPGNINALNWYKTRSLNAMIATATNAEGGMFFENEKRDQGDSSKGISVIKSFIQLAADKDVKGVLCTAWDDNSPHFENFWRGFIASAEYAWSPNGRTLDEYDAAWLQKEFGLSMPDYVNFNNQLSLGSILWYEAFFENGNLFSHENRLQSLVQLEHWLKPLEGQEKIDFDYSTKLIELPDLKSPGLWSKKYQERLNRSLIEMKNYKSVSERLAYLYNSSKRNKYYWKLASVLYNLQIQSPKILLALKECDTSEKNQQKLGFEKVKIAIKEFEQSWADVQNVYSQTRFVSYPSNYIPDRYFHLASQREDLSWMIQAEEMYLKMVEKWIQSNQ